jgi:hypothetical protein
LVEGQGQEGADRAEFESDGRLISEYEFGDHKSDSYASETDISDMFTSGAGSSADFEGQVTAITEFADDGLHGVNEGGDAE